jgi:hypothetical protein
LYLKPLSKIFQLYRGSQFDSDLRQVDSFLMLYRVHLTWVGFELTTLVEIGIDIGPYVNVLLYFHLFKKKKKKKIIINPPFIIYSFY